MHRFTVSLSYYGTLFFLPNLPGDRHINFIMGAVVEISGYFIEFWLFTKYGRKFPMIGYQMLNSVVCISIAIMSVYQTPDHPTISEYISIVNLEDI